jgi:hypothetical protein
MRIANYLLLALSLLLIGQKSFAQLDVVEKEHDISRKADVQSRG